MNELMQKEVVSRQDIYKDSLAIIDRLEKRKQLDIQFKLDLFLFIRLPLIQSVQRLLNHLFVAILD